MKVKFKISIEQFFYLLNHLQNGVFTGLTELQILNIRTFIKNGLKKLIDLQSAHPFNNSKVKSFSIDVNQYSAIMAHLTNERNTLDPFMLTVWLTLQAQNKQLIHLN
jgi:hypothetical protein